MNYGLTDDVYVKKLQATINWATIPYEVVKTSVLLP